MSFVLGGAYADFFSFDVVVPPNAQTFSLKCSLPSVCTELA